MSRIIQMLQADPNGVSLLEMRWWPYKGYTPVQCKRNLRTVSYIEIDESFWGSTNWWNCGIGKSNVPVRCDIQVWWCPKKGVRKSQDQESFRRYLSTRVGLWRGYHMIYHSDGSFDAGWNMSAPECRAFHTTLNDDCSHSPPLTSNISRTIGWNSLFEGILAVRTIDTCSQQSAHSIELVFSSSWPPGSNHSWVWHCGQGETRSMCAYVRIKPNSEKDRGLTLVPMNLYRHLVLFTSNLSNLNT